MLADKEAIANIAVKDLAVARAFYEGPLGLVPIATRGDALVTYRSGGTRVFVYQSEFAGTNRATALTWALGDELPNLAGRLKAAGVPFVHYALPGMVLEGDVHVGHGMKIAWFTDPDGNILSLVSG